MPLLLALCFVLSGSVALILQVVWVRMLIDVLGSSSLAIATVLATFMGGLALGSYLGGILADLLVRGPKRDVRYTRDPLLYYGCAEVMVGLSALLVPTLVGWLAPLSASLWRAMPESPIPLALCRMGLCSLVLLLPTTAMGATLPLLTRRVTRDPDELALLGRRIGTLYAANSGGAVVGAGLAGFALLPALGLSTTAHVAAVAALALGGAVVVAAWHGARRRVQREPAAATPASATPASPVPGSRRLILLCYAGSGAVAMALEVLLSRALAVVNGSSVYSFTLVLVTFLAGISLGSALAARPAARVKDPRRGLAILLLATAFAIGLAVLSVDDLPAMSLALLDGTQFEIDAVLMVHAAVTAICIAPIALGLGAVMPFAMRAYVGELDAVGRDVGRAYAANTIGAIVGSLAAGLVLMPALGIEHALRLLALVDVGLAVALLVASRARKRHLAVAALTGAFALLVPGWNLSDFTAGLFRGHLARAYLTTGGLYPREVVSYADGVATTVSVERSGEHWLLKNNGKVEASNRADMPTQILVGLLPIVAHPGDGQRVFVIGYGSGVTVGAITQAPEVASIDVVELEPEVLAAADRYFGDFNHRAQDDPRVHRRIGDGRQVLTASKARYDVIVSEPSNPWIAGVANLFSRDFYRHARARLAPGGIFCQWAQLYELGPASVKMIYASFAAEFPYVYAFTPGDETTDTILLGSAEPLPLDLEALAARMRASPSLAAELDRALVDRPEELYGSLFLAPDEVASFTAGAPINTDDNARLEHVAPRDLLAAVRGNHFARAVRGEDWPYGHLEGLVSGLGDGPTRAGHELSLARTLLAYGRRREALTWLALARADHAEPSEWAVVDRLERLTRAVDFRDPEMLITAGGPPLSPPTAEAFADPDPDHQRAGLATLAAASPLLAQGNWPEAWRLLGKLPKRALTDRGREVGLLAAYAAYKSVELASARAILLNLVRHDDFVAHRPAVEYYLGRAEYGLGAFRAGIDQLEVLARRWPTLCDQALAARLPSR